MGKHCPENMICIHLHNKHQTQKEPPLKQLGGFLSVTDLLLTISGDHAV